MKTTHKQKTIVVDGYRIEVDAKLAKLIKGLCKAGYYTELSCEDNINDLTWIYFPDWCADKLMRDVFAVDKKLFFYLASTANWSLVYCEETRQVDIDEFEETGELEVGHSLRFPKKDLPVVEKMFLEFFKKVKK